MNNTTRKNVLINTLRAALGLCLFSFGVYLTIQANIGVAPWDAFNLGLSHTFGIKYGNASIIVSVVIVIIDILLKEPVGIGMLLDAFLVGKFVDLFDLIGIMPQVEGNLPLSLVVILAGIVILGIGQEIYMKAGLGCGPRDSLLVGLKRRTSRIPIGLISVAIQTTVALIGWLLGGPIGIGTIICAFLEGPVMQLDFRILRFEPTDVKHQNILESVKVLSKQWRPR